MIKKCVICGKEFKCTPSRNIVTCSYECRMKHLSSNHKGRKMPDAAKQKMRKARLDNPSNKEIQKKATEAAKKSPKSGKFETNRKAIDWHLVSPDGRHFFIHSLRHWLRNEGAREFGIDPDSKDYINTISGLSRVKKSVLGTLPPGQRPGYTHKGWQVIPTRADERKAAEKRKQRE